MPLQASKLTIGFHSDTTPAVLDSIRQLAMPTLWRRKWSEEVTGRILRWRFRDLNGAETLLALDGDCPVGMISSYLRPYQVDGEIVQLREASDWICLPEYRAHGLGVRLMCYLMDRQEPLLIIGGNENAQTVLPALGWHRLPDIVNYTLPLSTKYPLTKVWRSLGLPLSFRDVSRSSETRWPRWPALRGIQYAARSCYHAGPSQMLPATVPNRRTYELLPLIRDHEMSWLYAAPKEMGRFFVLAFPDSDGPLGFSVGRIYSDDGIRYAKLIHIQTSAPSGEAYGGMLAATIKYCRDQGADVVQFRAFCKVLRQTLRECGFMRPRPTPVYWWSKNGRPPGSNLHLTFLRGDDGIRPYPN